MGVGGVELCAETFGDPAAPAILLIADATASMDWWNAELCRPLAAGGRFMIRYDHRDTGRSVSYAPGALGYTGADLAGDAAGLIDVLAGGRAHLVGLSMGGGIAQHLAVHHPDRVATLTLMSTSPGPAEDLPPMAERLRAVFADPAPEPHWTDRDAVVDYLVEVERPFAGPYSSPSPSDRVQERPAGPALLPGRPRSSCVSRSVDDAVRCGQPGRGTCALSAPAPGVLISTPGADEAATHPPSPDRPGPGGPANPARGTAGA